MLVPAARESLLAEARLDLNAVVMIAIALYVVAAATLR